MLRFASPRLDDDADEEGSGDSGCRRNWHTAGGPAVKETSVMACLRRAPGQKEKAERTCYSREDDGWKTCDDMPRCRRIERLRCILEERLVALTQVNNSVTHLHH